MGSLSYDTLVLNTKTIVTLLESLQREVELLTRKSGATAPGTLAAKEKLRALSEVEPTVYRQMILGGHQTGPEKAES